jgi:hypothetical protein
MRALLLVCVFAVNLPGADPRAVSIFPFTGQRGVAFTATVRGANLKDARAAYLETEGLRVTVESAAPEVVPPGMPKPRTPMDAVRIRVETAPTLPPGRYPLRLVTPSGVSNALPLLVTGEDVVSEPSGSHELPETAVPVPALPVTFSGRIDTRGESDFYVFDARAGETLTFQAISGLPSIGAPGGNANGFDPSLSIYESAGSWFDPKRVNRIAFNDEPLWVIGRATDAHLVHTFAKPGRYYLRLEAFSGQGGADYGYQLKIQRGAVPPDAPPVKDDWEERSYQRKLSSNRLNELAARGGKPQTQKSIETYRMGGEFKLPATLEGAIAKPGEWHRAKFRADGPADIAIEVETPDTAPPLFNPVIRMLDSNGEEVVTNVFAGRGACTGALTKGLVAKAIFPLRNPGEYTVEVRDVTADLAAPDFRYRVQIRPQIPHIGGVRIEEDHINLAPDGARTVRVSFDREEDYRGAVAVQVENLPDGVTALAAADFEPDKDPPPYPGKRERYVPRTERTVVAFTAAKDAPLMTVPRAVRITVRPVMDGRPGPVIASKQIPLMVVEKP